MAEHVHVWEPPVRTHVGWYVRCRDHIAGEATGSCDAWFSVPTDDPPTRVPEWMEATVGAAVVVPTPIRVLGQKVADGVIYPPNVPSNTIDARPPKPSQYARSDDTPTPTQSGDSGAPST